MIVRLPKWVWALLPVVVAVFVRHPDVAADTLGGIFQGLSNAADSIASFVTGLHPHVAKPT